MKLLVTALAVLAATAAYAAPPHPVIYGVWTASAGPALFHGTLSAQAAPVAAAPGG